MLGLKPKITQSFNTVLPKPLSKSKLKYINITMSYYQLQITSLLSFWPALTCTVLPRDPIYRNFYTSLGTVQPFFTPRRNKETITAMLTDQENALTLLSRLWQEELQPLSCYCKFKQHLNLIFKIKSELVNQVQKLKFVQIIRNEWICSQKQNFVMNN